MKPASFARLLGLCAVVAIVTVAGARADDANTTTIKFSDPAKPGTLKLSIGRGDVRIEGTDTAEVAVRSEAQPKQKPRKDGLRVLTEAASFSLTEKDNTVVLDALSEGWNGAPSDFKISVPRGTNIVIAASYGGDVVCTGITGDYEVKSLQGDVRLEGVVGAALVETNNGEITANIQEVHEGKTLSFTSMNGAVLLRVPSTAKANVRLRTLNGTILTDFDEKILVTKVENAGATKKRGTRGSALAPEAREAFRQAARAGAEAARHAAEAIREAAEAAAEGASDGDSRMAIPPIPPVPPVIPTVTGGKLVTGTLNGGGVEIDVKTMNGEITLRQAEKK